MMQVVLEQPKKVVVKDVAKPAAARGQVLIQVKRIGVCGSDIHAYYGKHPFISCPIVQGHEFSGEIVQVGDGVKGLRLGDVVTVRPQVVCGTCYACRHGNYNICSNLKVIGCQVPGAAQEFLAVDASVVVKLPKGMSLDFGAMVEPVAVGVHALRRLGDVKGMNLVVLGAGPIGNLTAQSAQAMGARSVIITDVSEPRLEIARRCGVRHAVNVAQEDLGAAILKVCGDDRADAFLECVGASATIEQAVALARKGSDIIVVGVYEQKASVDMGLAQDKELRLIGTLMYKAEDYQDALRLMSSGALTLEPLITNRFPLARFADAYAHIEANRATTMKVLIELGG